MGATDRILVSVDADDRVVRVDDDQELSRDVAARTGDVTKYDCKIIGGSAAEVLILSPHRLFLNDDNNSLTAFEGDAVQRRLRRRLTIRRSAKNRAHPSWPQIARIHPLASSL